MRRFFLWVALTAIAVSAPAADRRPNLLSSRNPVGAIEKTIAAAPVVCPPDGDSLDDVTKYACFCYQELDIKDDDIRNLLSADFDCTDGGTLLTTEWTVPVTTPLKAGCVATADGANQTCELNAGQDGQAAYANWPDGSPRPGPRLCRGGTKDMQVCTQPSDCPSVNPGACLGTPKKCTAGLRKDERCDTDEHCPPDEQGSCEVGRCKGGADDGKLCVKPATCRAPGTCTQALGFPPQCDNPSWLSNKCYGHSYIKRLRVDAAKDVDAMLLCRHKETWSSATNDFDDIAIIMRNKKNGKTCWFQAEKTGSLDGKKIPPPHNGAKAKAFWRLGPNPDDVNPKAAAAVNCIGCHDQGPWMNSPWIFRADVVPTDKGKYTNIGKAFKDWPTPEQVTIAKQKMKDKGFKASCSGCHKISRTLYSGTRMDPGGQVGSGENMGTPARWIDYTTGGGPGFDKFPSRTSAFGRTWPRAGWMPGETYPKDHDKAQWVKVYKDYIAFLKACAADPSNAGCEKQAFAAILPNGLPTRATLTAALASGPVLQRTATSTDGWIYGTINSFISDSVTLSWNADGVAECHTDLTLPETMYELGGVRNGTSWPTDVGTILLGPLPNPGEYVLDIACYGPHPPDSYDEPPFVGVTVVVNVPTPSTCP